MQLLSYAKMPRKYSFQPQNTLFGAKEYSLSRGRVGVSGNYKLEYVIFRDESLPVLSGFPVFKSCFRV